MFTSIRKLHIRRFADIVYGSAVNGAKTKIQKLALKKSLDVSKGRAVFNQYVRDNSPTIYLVDPELIANTVIKALIVDYKYIDTIRSPRNNVFIPIIDKSFESTHNSIKQDLIALESVITKAIHIDLAINFESISSTEISDIVTPIYEKVLADMANAEKLGRRYISFQAAAATAGAELRRKLNSIKVSRISDGSAIVANLEKRIPFIAYRFSAGVSTINKIIQNSVDKVLAPYLRTNNSFIVGNLLHAGHVGLYDKNGLLGINTPGGLIGGLVSNKFEEIESAIGNIPIHIEQGIKLTTNYSASAGMFLDLQFNFAVSMTSNLNSAILGPQEVAAIAAITGNIAEEALQNAIKEQIGSSSIIQQVVEVGASPSIKEFIVNSVLDILTTGKTGILKNAANTKSASDLISTKPLKRITKSTAKAKAPSSPQPRQLRTTAGQFTSLVSLQNLLNQNLRSQIQQNMGTGERKDILNYRTGRFAESAKVETMSQSREGMITAFYSYMRNPYATFSFGGAQSSPATRDPKLLISRSIREIGATMVGNRMRAVLV